jgi:hypothetical protein
MGYSVFCDLHVKVNVYISADGLQLSPFFFQTAPVQRPSSGGWRVELFESTSGLTSTPMSFRNLSLVAVGDVLHVDMDSNVGSAWSSFPRAARLRFQGGARQMPAGPFAWRFVGRIRVETAGDYTFCTESDDGSLFYLDLNPISAESQNVFYTLVIDNDGLHSATQRCQTVPLQQGTYHAKVHIEWTQSSVLPSSFETKAFIFQFFSDV